MVSDCKRINRKEARHYSTLRVGQKVEDGIIVGLELTVFCDSILITGKIQYSRAAENACSATQTQPQNQREERRVAGTR